MTEGKSQHHSGNGNRSYRLHNIYQVNISLTRWENLPTTGSVVRTEEEFNWLISRRTVIPLSVYPSHWFRLSEEWFSTARLYSLWRWSSGKGRGEGSHRALNWSPMKVGCWINARPCKTRVCVWVFVWRCVRDDSVNKSDGQDNAHSLCLGF